MAVISQVVLFVLGVIGAAASRILADEFKDWTPWIVDKLIRRAVARLPKEQQDRFNEEWRSYINDTPGQIGKLWQAFGFLKAAEKSSGRVKIDSHFRDHSAESISIRFLLFMTASLSGIAICYTVYRALNEDRFVLMAAIGAGLLWTGVNFGTQRSFLLWVDTSKNWARLTLQLVLRVLLSFLMAFSVSQALLVRICETTLDQEFQRMEFSSAQREGNSEVQTPPARDQNTNTELRLRKSSQPTFLQQYEILKRIEADPSHPDARVLFHFEWGMILLFFMFELTPLILRGLRKSA